jgi:hypothetical protein
MLTEAPPKPPPPIITEDGGGGGDDENWHLVHLDEASGDALALVTDWSQRTGIYTMTDKKPIKYAHMTVASTLVTVSQFLQQKGDRKRMYLALVNGPNRPLMDSTCALAAVEFKSRTMRPYHVVVRPALLHDDEVWEHMSVGLARGLALLNEKICCELDLSCFDVRGVFEQAVLDELKNSGEVEAN